MVQKSPCPPICLKYSMGRQGRWVPPSPGHLYPSRCVFVCVAYAYILLGRLGRPRQGEMAVIGAQLTAQWSQTSMTIKEGTRGVVRAHTKPHMPTGLVLYVWGYPKCHLVIPNKGEMTVIGA